MIQQATAMVIQIVARHMNYIKLLKTRYSLAFTNHGGIYDWIKKKQEIGQIEAKIKYIHAIELYMCTELENNEKDIIFVYMQKIMIVFLELNELYSLSTSKGIKIKQIDIFILIQEYLYQS